MYLQESLTDNIYALAVWPWYTHGFPTMSNDSVQSPTGYGQHFISEAWSLSGLPSVYGGKQLSSTAIFVYWLVVYNLSHYATMCMLQYTHKV